MKVELLECELAPHGGQRATIKLIAQTNEDRRILQELHRAKLLKEPLIREGKLHSGQFDLRGIDLETFLPPSLRQRTV